MATLVVVGATDHLAKIAARHGIRDPQRIWDDPENAELRELRSNPNLLREGDEIAVPDRDPPSFEVPAGRRHGFRVPIATVELSCRLLDLFGEPIADAAVHARIDDTEHDLVTDGDGKLTVPIRAGTERVRLELDDRVFELEVGRLDPIDTPTGLRARLTALGYLSGDLDGDDPEDVRFAIELFQHDNALAVDGIVDDEVIAAIEQAFGT
jgi:Putative peptidoglycan binding domain